MGKGVRGRCAVPSARVSTISLDGGEGEMGVGAVGSDDDEERSVEVGDAAGEGTRLRVAEPESSSDAGDPPLSSPGMRM